MSIPIPAEDPRHVPNRAVVDTSAITHNTRVIVDSLREHTALMAVVKADGYGHGMLSAARAAVAGGATWLGVAHPASALALSRAGIEVPIFSWLYEPRTAAEILPAVVAEGVEISVGSLAMLKMVADAARQADRRARVHVKIDTGMGRNGALPAKLAAIGSAAREDEFIRLSGAWTHLSAADDPEDPMTDQQVEIFDSACEALEEEAGPIPLQHLANTAATLTRRDLHRDIVRPGIGLYGYPPVATDLDLRPALTLTSRLALVKDVPAGQTVGYGHRFTTPAPTRLGLVPIGYADGLPRAASGGVSVLVRSDDGDHRAQQVGRISMDQIVVDLGSESRARAGDEVVLFGAAQALAPLDDDASEVAVTPQFVASAQTEGEPELEQEPAQQPDAAADADSPMEPRDDEEPAPELEPESTGTSDEAPSAPALADLDAAEPTLPDDHPGVPTADDWATAAGTIPYEILTSVSNRVPREQR
ncbi:alanine racemase [Brachybacterium halotolerans subsp. kimchii]|uniref:alanine racemase n=1 Tax=Brachybacterium halotolerans TaxID=2795215 RepID=UPI001E4764C2|nr:alanine racemase [Brachybacterium halotolerans]UEJ82366.1 alanine racemase [Brachybacterium halotolerans subsp. kimchii]